VRALATSAGTGDPEGLLADPRTVMLVALDGERPVGFVLAHELPRRDGDRSGLFVYEVEVAPGHRRRGVGSALLERLAELAGVRGIRSGLVLTEQTNEAASTLYERAGGTLEGVNAVWRFTYVDG